MEQEQKTNAKGNSGEQPLPVPRRIRGTLTIKADDDMEFRAQRSTGLKMNLGKIMGLLELLGEKMNRHIQD